MKIKNWGEVLLLPTLLILISTSCNKSKDLPLSPLAAEGKAVYMSNCIACHNPDPKIAGSIGPDLAGSSLELLQWRVVKAEYPPGYKGAKRDSKMMPAFPQLEASVPALHAYLNSFSK